MQSSRALTFHPLVVLELLAIGIAAIFFTHAALAAGLWLIFTGVLQWRMRVRISLREWGYLLAGSLIWAGLRYLNQSEYSVSQRIIDASWTFFHFALILWYSVVVLRLTSLWGLVSQMESAGQRVLGARAWIGQLALISVLAMRFIPALGRSAQHLRAEAKMRRSLARGERHWLDAFRFITPLVMLSIIRSEVVAEALWTRGWRPHVRPLFERWRGSDTAWSVALIIFLIVAWKEKI